MYSACKGGELPEKPVRVDRKRFGCAQALDHICGCTRLGRPGSEEAGEVPINYQEDTPNTGREKKNAKKEKNAQ